MQESQLTYHGLGGVELVVIELTKDTLGEGLGSLHEFSNTLGVGLLEMGLDGSHVLLKVSSVGLLIERSGGQVVTILQVVDGLGVRLKGSLLSFLSVGLNVVSLSDGDVLKEYQ